MRELRTDRYRLAVVSMGGPAWLTLTRGERVDEATYQLVPRADRKHFRRVPGEARPPHSTPDLEPSDTP